MQIKMKRTRRLLSEKAQKNNSLMASANISVLQGTGMGFASGKTKGAELESLKEETIGGETIKKLAAMEQTEGFSLSGSDKNQPVIKVFNKQTDKWEGTAIKINDGLISVLATPKAYAGQTVRGIKVGSAFSEVKAMYGEPARVVSSRQGNYYIYEKTEIIFNVRQDDTVAGWMLYAME